MKKSYVDPEEERWDRKYPRFPGVAKCVELLGSSNVNGGRREVLIHKLEQHARAHSDELIAAAREELACRSGVGPILLTIIADSKLPAGFELFAELLRSSDETLRHYAIEGLKLLDTKAARQLLWEHGAA